MKPTERAKITPAGKPHPKVKGAAIKQLSNPFSTGGGGVLFECAVQAGFVVKLITGGFAPCLKRSWPIVELRFQGKRLGYHTDDLVVIAEDKPDGRRARLLAQIKHTITISARDPVFNSVVAAAWTDFNNPKAFNPEFDAIALITGPLSAADILHVRSLLHSARTSITAKSFFADMKLAKFTSATKREKLAAFKEAVKAAKRGVTPNQHELWRFLRAFHLVGYDLDQDTGGHEAIFKSLLSQFSAVDELWSTIYVEVGKFNVSAGTLTMANLPAPIRDALKQRVHREQLDVPGPQPTAAPDPVPAAFTGTTADARVAAALTGGWTDKSAADLEILRKISGK